MDVQRVLIDGTWREAAHSATFSVTNPATGEVSAKLYPVSTWSDCDAALDAAAAAAIELRSISGEAIAAFLESYAGILERRAKELVAIANVETGLPISPRLRDVELPRTITQLRQGAAAAREGSWQRPVIDTRNNIRSHFAPIGPVAVFGPNNFPFAFNGVAGGDFTAAIAAGNPVIAKGHPLHAGTTELLAQCAWEALEASALPKSTVQLVYKLRPDDGLRLVSDPRTGASGFTGGRNGGLRLKEAADKAGKPIYCELSSLNPVVILPGALRERGAQMATDLADSALAGVGQFCTSPNLVMIVGEEEAERFAAQVVEIYEARTPSVLLSNTGLEALDRSVHELVSAGAKVRIGAARFEGNGCRYRNTLLQVTAAQFLAAREALQVEAFGNSTMLIAANSEDELLQVLDALEGNLTGCIYSSSAGEEEELCARVSAHLRFKVGRLLNDKMPTGVALSPAMNHGGPFPSTGHPGFTAVGIPASMLRFAALHSYDNVREPRLPPALRNRSPNPGLWRSVDGSWTQGDLP